jgi:hypothetical protein
VYHRSVHLVHALSDIVELFLMLGLQNVDVGSLSSDLVLLSDDVVLLTENLVLLA